MDVISELARTAQALRVEQNEDFALHKEWLERSNIQERKRNGITWFPLKIVETGFGMGAYPFVVVERNPGDKLDHRFQSASPVSLFSAAPGNEAVSINGTIGYVDDQRMKISFFLDELPEWMDDGKIGVNLMFDSRSYDEMFKALNFLINTDKGRIKILRDTILGARNPDFSPLPKRSSPKLNDSQNAALQNIAEAQDLAIVHGPPGTGKTTTLIESIKELLKEEKQIMICAPSNAATDHLARGLFLSGLRVVRVGNVARVETDNTSLTLDVLIQSQKDYKQIKELKKRAIELRRVGGKYKRSFGREEAEQRKLIFNEARNLSKEARELENHIVQRVLDDAQVIACTLIGSTSDYLSNRKFSTVVIDEAGQGIEPAVWVPILKAEKVVMAGDPFQLPPTVKSRESEKMGLSVTLLEKAIKRHENINLLNVQYRMNDLIMEFSNRKFYHNQLRSHASVKDWKISENDRVLEFIDTAGCGFDEKAGEENGSLCNPEEVQLIRKHLDLFLVENSAPFSIGIISPYRAQVELLQAEFSAQKQENKSITINTVDSFQGQERDVIYISMVRSNAKSEIGFLKDYRRMNVAMTRAKKKLVIIGDSATLGNDKFYADFLEYTESIGAYRTGWELMY
jgi:ATP-dependent RNA/DNA helicase IGHMBP2